MAQNINERTQLLWAFAATSLAVFPLIFCELIKTGAPNWAFKGLIGIALGIFLEAAHSARRGTLSRLRKNGLRALSSNHGEAIAHLLAIFVFSILAMLIWAAGWEGLSTGLFYGIGSWAGVKIAKRGMAPLLEAHYQVPKI